MQHTKRPREEFDDRDTRVKKQFVPTHVDFMKQYSLPTDLLPHICYFVSVRDLSTLMLLNSTFYQCMDGNWSTCALVIWRELFVRDFPSAGAYLTNDLNKWQHVISKEKGAQFWKEFYKDMLLSADGGYRQLCLLSRQCKMASDSTSLERVKDQISFISNYDLFALKNQTSSLVAPYTFLKDIHRYESLLDCLRSCLYYTSIRVSSMEAGTKKFEAKAQLVSLNGEKLHISWLVLCESEEDIARRHSSCSGKVTCDPLHMFSFDIMSADTSALAELRVIMGLEHVPLNYFACLCRILFIPEKQFEKIHIKQDYWIAKLPWLIALYNYDALVHDDNLQHQDYLSELSDHSWKSNDDD